MTARLDLTRGQILGFRRRVGALDERLLWGKQSLRRAAWAGLQDSMPRAALLSIHARLKGTKPTALDDSSLVQVWGPRFSVFVVAARDRAIFTLGRFPDDARGQQRALDMADRLDAFLDGERMPFGKAGRGVGVSPNALRYGAPTGRLLLQWDGARQPEVWTVPAPEMDIDAARLELARRYLHVFGPGTAQSFGGWAGRKSAGAVRAFEGLQPELTPVRTPIGKGWILSSDEGDFRPVPDGEAGARLLPSGDAYYLLWGADRELLVPEAKLRALLWTSRVWPGAVLLAGEIVGTWRRSGSKVTIEPWHRLSGPARRAVEDEALSLPLPGLDRGITVHWDA